MNLQNVLESALKDNGISFSINTGACNLDHGYMASRYGCETISETLNLDIIIAYIKYRASELAELDAYLGIWYKNDQWYLDVSEHFLNRNMAIKYGKKNKQLAIWDCANCEEITL